MIDLVSITNRQERTHVLISNVTEDVPVREADARAHLRVFDDGLSMDEFWIADDDDPRSLRAKARDALRGLRRARVLSSG